MSIIDWLIVIVIFLSALISFIRGCFKAATSVATWTVAILSTLYFTPRLAGRLPTDIFQTNSSQYIGSAVLLFFGSLFIGGVISWLFRQAVGGSTLGPVDRSLGIIFGTARGLLMIAILVFMSNLLPEVKRESWWIESRLLPRFQEAAMVIHAHLPFELAVLFDLPLRDNTTFRLSGP